MLSELKLPHGTLQLPIFLPDGTQGVVRTLDARDLEDARIQAVQMNVFPPDAASRLFNYSGIGRIAPHGRLATGLSFTDSGGFQVYSLLRQNAKSGSINDKGAQLSAPKALTANLTSRQKKVFNSS